LTCQNQSKRISEEDARHKISRDTKNLRDPQQNFSFSVELPGFGQLKFVL